MADPPVRVRPYRHHDRAAAIALATRLEIGVAPWRDAAAVRAAVTQWVGTSLDLAGAHDRAVLVAVCEDVLVGFVTVSQRRHFTGELDAYVGELVVAEEAQRRGGGR